jgi:hypothetical protein
VKELSSRIGDVQEFGHPLLYFEAGSVTWLINFFFAVLGLELRATP